MPAGAPPRSGSCRPCSIWATHLQTCAIEDRRRQRSEFSEIERVPRIHAASCERSRFSSRTDRRSADHLHAQFAVKLTAERIIDAHDDCEES